MSKDIREYIDIVNESSLSRLWRMNDKYDCGALTAFRKGQDCGQGEPYTRSDNAKRNKSLLAKLKSKGYSVTTLKGQYPEGGETQKEISFFVVDINDTGNLPSDIAQLGSEFEQDSVLIVPRGSLQNQAHAYLLGTNNCDNNWLGMGQKEVFNKGKIGYDSPIYTSYVNGRPFIFEDVSELEESSPASGMGVWAMHRAAEKHWSEL